MNNHSLKIIALCAMFFDHVIRIFPLSDILAPLNTLGDLLIAHGYQSFGMFLIEWFPFLLKFIGRLAAPIFLFCLVQGFLNTHNIKKYILRLFLTAVLAQGPYILFNLAENRIDGFYADWSDCGLNILFTLSLGLCTLAAFEYFRKRNCLLLGIAMAILACVLSRFLQLEGHEGYILIIFSFYILRNCSLQTKLLIFLPIIILSRYQLVYYTFLNTDMLRSCILNVLGNYLGVLITFFSSGKRGNSGKRFQLFMYTFYPVHLFVLAVIGFLRPIY